MTLSIEVGPEQLCVSLRKTNQGHVEWIEACASNNDGGRFACVGASLALFDFREARMRRGGRPLVKARELVALHGFDDLAADRYVDQRFERFDPLAVDRLLVLRAFHGRPPSTTLDLALVRRTVELTRADVLLSRWPPAGPNPERWARCFESTALRLDPDAPAGSLGEPVWLFQRAAGRWPVELVARSELLELVGETPSLQRTG